jgi:hypothetical protein
MFTLFPTFTRGRVKSYIHVGEFVDGHYGMNLYDQRRQQCLTNDRIQAKHVHILYKNNLVPYVHALYLIVWEIWGKIEAGQPT